MSRQQTHTIQRQILELELPREKDAYALQRRASHLYQLYVLPTLDSFFSSLVEGDEQIVISTVEIDLGVLKLENWEDTFIKSCLENIKKQLEANIKEIRQSDCVTGAIQSSEVALLQQFIHFLRYGRLQKPVAFFGEKEQIEAKLLKVLRKEKATYRSFVLRALSDYTAATRRLIWQFSAPFLLEFITIVFDHSWDQRDREKFLALNPEQREQFFRALLQQISNQQMQKSVSEIVQSHLEKVSKIERSIEDKDDGTIREQTSEQTDLESMVEEEENPTQKEKLQIQKDEAIWIENSGMVLLHPFLERFLEACGLMQKSQFVSKDAQHTALHLLQYLCTGDVEHFEFSLMLNKLLCDVPLEEPIRRNVEISNEMRAEADQLLGAVIEHWSALKNTSVDGLRESFLQRQGKLMQLDDKNCRLQVERKSMDILLDWLPWSISYIQLPWLPFVLHVEWHN